MVIKVGINGFGRIGRITFRTCFQNSEIQLTAINDPAIDIEYICYLIKFDSTHGKFKGNVTHTDDEIIINDHKIKVFQEKVPPDVPWHKAGVQYVIEASGMFTCLEKASGHLASEGVKRVLVTAPSVDVPMVVLGVNDHILNKDHRVVSCTSSTLYCLAPIIKVLNENFGVAEGFITSIHAMTPSLKPLDGLCLRGKHWRDHRSINQNIIPATTGACKALSKILPQVKDKMTGLAFRVPIINVSVLDITVKLNTNTSLEHIVKSVEKASKRELKNIIRISNESAVSSDFTGDSHSCIVDVDSSLQLRPDFYKIICWYENEYSYACRVVDAIFFSEIQFAKSNMLASNTTCLQAKLQKQILAPIQNSSQKITLQCNCSKLPTDDIFFINSNDSIKELADPKPQTLFVQKPVSSYSSSTASTLQNRDTKKKNEIFKVWNDDCDSSKKSVRQNRNSIFHSCITFGPNSTLGKAECMKVQDRLENVKREFSKMLIITEDLLKKSSNSKNKLQALGCKEMTEGDLNLELQVQSLQETKSISKRKYTNKDLRHTIVKDCGDFKTKASISSINNSKDNDSKASNSNLTKAMTCLTEVDDNRIVYDRKRKLRASDTPRLAEPRAKQNEHQAISKCNNTANVISNLNRRTDHYDKDKNSAQNDAVINTQFVHSIKSLTNAITNKLVENVFSDLKKTVPIKSEKITNNSLKLGETNTLHTRESKHNTHKLDDKLPTNREKTELNYIKDLTKHLENSSHDMRIIDEELKKRNIVVMNSNSNTYGNIDVKPVPVDADANRKNFDLNKKILADLKIVAEKGDEGISPCGSPSNTVTTISNGDRARVKEDLYDKLDSASTSDSNNSFQINERKSQVLNIRDLTNSLEDLSRLDKICRIIEISDELSDKLFSNLDNTENSLEKEKKWSFRDLCERLKLDEFCDSVFGKTSF